MSKMRADGRDHAALDAKLLRRLLAMIKPFSFLAVVALLLLVLGKFAANAVPRVVQQAIDGPIATRHLEGLWWPILLYLGLRLFSFLSLFLQGVVTAHIGQTIIATQRSKLFAHAQTLSHRYFGRTPVGRLMSRIVNDTDVLNELFSSGFITILGDVLTLVFILGFMFTLHVQLTLVSLITLPLVLWVSWFFKTRLRELFRAIRGKTADLNTHLQESVTGMRVIQLFGQEQRDASRFDVHNREYFGLFRKVVFQFSLFYPLMELLGTVTLALILWYGGMRYLSGGVTVGVLVAFINYTEDLFHPIRDLAEKFNLLQNAMASSERVFSLMDEKEQLIEPTEPRAVTKINGAITFRDVHFGYLPEKKVLRGLSFSVNPGETVALVGPSGAGKSTVLHLLNRFYDVEEGDLLLDGHPVHTYAAATLRSSIVTVSQDLFAFTGTIMENLRLGDENVSEARVIAAAEKIRAHEFIEKLPHGYHSLLNERGSNLSTGQKQLLAFARALARDPSVLILDEATSSVDPYTEQLIQEAIRTMKQGRTCIMVAHRLSTVRDADRILVLRHGKIEEEGTHEALIRSGGLYAKLHQIQFA